MKKSMILLGIMALIAVISVGLYIYFDSTSNSKNIAQDNGQSESQIYSNNSNGQNIINEINNLSIPQNSVISSRQSLETEIASFSTNLKGDNARLNNIKITCNTLNGTIINSGETFSFNTIIGQPTAERGYQEADVFVNQKTEKGYGGGNCQVSTTLYNAALNVEGIEIIERHAHKKKVSYIEEGKDAAVSYSGGLDLQFKNNTENQLKLYVNSDEDSVDVKIIKVS